MKFDKYNSDKVNDLFSYYEDIFSGLKDKPIKYLEIGVWEGGSLQWASDFFKKGDITGVDINIPKGLSIPRTHLIQGSQESNDFLSVLGSTYGNFDIIIDDASHKRALTANTFNALWQYVKKGGWYVIEDWHAGYLNNPNIYKGMVELVAEIMINKPIYKIDNIIIIKKHKSFAAFQKKLG